MPVNIAELERRARRLLTPGVYDYYAGGVGREQTLRAGVVVSNHGGRQLDRALWALACDGAGGVQDLLTGITADLAHAMALAGARTLTDAAGVTAPTTAHSLDT